MVNVIIENRPDVAIIMLQGVFDLENRVEVEKVWDSQLGKNPGIIAFDCRELAHIDSSAIGLLVKFLTTAMNCKIKLVLLDLNDGISEIFRIARLDTFFTVTTRANFEQELAAVRSSH